MNKAAGYIAELRAPFLTVTVVPVILGAGLALKQGAGFSWFYFAASMAAFIFLHLGTNVLNDYFDNLNGTDNVNKNFIPPFTGGSRLIQSGVLKPSDVLAEGIVFFTLGIICFVPLILKSGPVMAGLLVFSLIAGIFYTAPPFKWAHLGLGEILIFISFGPVMVIGSYISQGGTDYFTAIMASLMPGLLTAAIVDINEFPDFEADEKTGKRNLVVRLGNEKGKLTYYTMVALAYLAVPAAVLLNALPAWTLLSLFASPLSIKASIILKENFDKPEKLAPACGMTVLAHLVSGILIILAIFLRN